MPEPLTLVLLDETIKAHEGHREQALAQANFQAGYLAALKAVREHIEQPAPAMPEIPAMAHFPNVIPVSGNGELTNMEAAKAKKRAN